MNTRTTDSRGRWYVETRPFSSADVALPDQCADCGAIIVHGVSRYFQRHDPRARHRELREHPETARTLGVLLFDSVCAPCGEAAMEYQREHAER